MAGSSLINWGLFKLGVLPQFFSTEFVDELIVGESRRIRRSAEPGVEIMSSSGN